MSNASKIPERLRIGTRGSRLALAQTELFISRIKEFYPDVVCEKVIIRTTGDKILDRPLVDFGGKAVFVSEFEQAISDGTLDCAVHSAKDLPTELAEGLTAVCVLPREDARDVLLTRAGSADAPHVIGTGSMRRQAQVREWYPDAVCRSLRGNVPTRIEKLRAGEYDGIILAAAGLKRLGLDRESDLSYRYFTEEEMVPAGGQGIIVIEGRNEDLAFYEKLTDKEAAQALAIERFVLEELQADCHEAVGVYAKPCITPEGAGVHLSLMREVDGTVVKRQEAALRENWKMTAQKLTEQMK